MSPLSCRMSNVLPAVLVATNVRNCVGIRIFSVNLERIGYNVVQKIKKVPENELAFEKKYYFPIEVFTL